jgi:hypothetical protein
MAVWRSHRPAAPPNRAGGRPWPTHDTYTEVVQDVIATDGRWPRATEVARRAGVGIDLATRLLHQHGALSRAEQWALILGKTRQIVDRDGCRTTVGGVARELRIHRRRADRALGQIGIPGPDPLYPDEDGLVTAAEVYKAYHLDPAAVTHRINAGHLTPVSRKPVKLRLAEVREVFGPDGAKRPGPHLSAEPPDG